jgi:hypothetical protein
MTEKATQDVQPGTGQQLTKFACLDCRRVFKRPVADIGKRNWPRPIEVRRCPSCRGDAWLMSSDFKAPPRDDLKRWEVVAYLVRAGLPYFKLYEPIPLGAVFGHPKGRPKGLLSAQRRIEPYPETMAEAVAFVARHRDKAQPIVRSED